MKKMIFLFILLFTFLNTSIAQILATPTRTIISICTPKSGIDLTAVCNYQVIVVKQGKKYVFGIAANNDFTKASSSINLPIFSGAAAYQVTILNDAFYFFSITTTNFNTAAPVFTSQELYFVGNDKQPYRISYKDFVTTAN